MDNHINHFFNFFISFYIVAIASKTVDFYENTYHALFPSRLILLDDYKAYFATLIRDESFVPDELNVVYAYSSSAVIRFLPTLEDFGISDFLEVRRDFLSEGSVAIIPISKSSSEGFLSRSRKLVEYEHWYNISYDGIMIKVFRKYPDVVPFAKSYVEKKKAG